MSGTLAYLSLAAAILLGIAGQIVLKSGAVGAPSLLAQLLNPLTIGGLAIYGLAGIAYIVALNRIPVSVAFPSVGASYAIVAVLAHVLWNEPLGWPQWGGIVLIAGGIILIHQAAA
jgi:undecaprenyl phosphate-alpha-L-ara4N flippase subunit ArnE